LSKNKEVTKFAQKYPVFSPALLFWQRPPRRHPLILMIVRVQVMPGCVQRLERLLRYVCLVGASSIYAGCDQEQLTIWLTWRGTARSVRRRRESALALLRARLADVCDWETATVDEADVELYAEVRR
jgi:hypothetical protein